MPKKSRFIYRMGPDAKWLSFGAVPKMKLSGADKKLMDLKPKKKDLKLHVQGEGRMSLEDRLESLKGLIDEAESMGKAKAMEASNALREAKKRPKAKKRLKASDVPKSSRTVAAYLAQEGYPGYKLVRGRGYWHFIDDEKYHGPKPHGDMKDMPGSSVHIYRISGYKLGQWLKALKEALDPYDLGPGWNR